MKISRWTVRRKRISFEQRVKKTCILLMVPAITFLAAFFVVPIAYSGWLSFRDFNFLYRTDMFIGLGNYWFVLQDGGFWMALLRTALYIGVVAFVDFVYAFAAALLIYILRPLIGKVLRGIIMLPMLLMPVSTAILWRYVVFNPPYQEFNRLLGLSRSFSILGNPSTALGGIIATVIWAWAPWMFILILAGLESLPPQPLEASQIDGANFLQRTWYIILPMLKPVIFVVLLLKCIDSFRSFTYPWVMTEGGPAGSSHLISTYIFQRSFRDLDYGYGAAMTMFSLIIPVFAVLLIFIYNKGGFRR